jgi:hypothetical protein
MAPELALVRMKLAPGRWVARVLELISGGAPVALSSEFEVGFAGEPGV